MTFYDHRLPTKFMRGAEGGLGFKTTVLTADSGIEQRNAEWSQCRGEWDLKGHFMWIDDPDTFALDVRDLRHFFMPHMGKLHTFRVRDEVDYQLGDYTNPASSYEVIGTGDGTTTVFQTTLTYDYDGIGYTYVRNIHGLVSGTTSVLLAGVVQGSGFTLDNLAGTVTFSVAPGVGVEVGIATLFDVICRADIDRLDITLDMISQQSQIPNIPVIEEKDPQP